jgi:hypothetical protein
VQRSREGSQEERTIVNKRTFVLYSPSVARRSLSPASSYPKPSDAARYSPNPRQRAPDHESSVHARRANLPHIRSVPSLERTDARDRVLMNREQLGTGRGKPRPGECRTRRCATTNTPRVGGSEHVERLRFVEPADASRTRTRSSSSSRDALVRVVQ